MQDVPMLRYRCQEGVGPAGEGLLHGSVLGTRCSQPVQSGPRFHLLEMDVDDMKLTAGILSLVFSCFNLATYFL